MERIVREDIGEDAFARLDQEPLAAASVAQIHGALMADGGRSSSRCAARGSRSRSISTSTSSARRSASWKSVPRPCACSSCGLSRRSSRCIFGASSHCGNVILTEDGRLALLDFGLLGRLDDETRTMLSLLLLAIARNRAEDVAALPLSLSLTTLDSDERGFLHELRRKLPRYQRRTLAGIKAARSPTASAPR